jgi:hypothetical protein
VTAPSCVRSDYRHPPAQSIAKIINARSLFPRTDLPLSDDALLVKSEIQIFLFFSCSWARRR